MFLYALLATLAACSHEAVADTKISQMTEGGNAQSSDMIPAVRSGANVRVTLGNYLTTASVIAPTGATTSDTLANRFSRRYSVLDFGAKCDGSTDDTAAFNLAIATASNGGLSGATIQVPNGVCMASQITLKRLTTLECANGWMACTLRQISGSNADFIVSENFASLTGTGANYGTNANVPSWFGLKDIHVDGNGGYQSSGRAIAWYGNAQMMLGHVLVENAKQDNIYTEASGSYAYSATDWKSQEEGFFDHVISRNAGGKGWLSRGPHNSVVINYLGVENADCGYQNEVSGTTYNGGVQIGLLHTYTETNGCGQVLNAPTSVVEAYNDNDTLTINSDAVKIARLISSACGAASASTCVNTNASFTNIGTFSFSVSTSAPANHVVLSIPSGKSSNVIGTITGTATTPTNAVTLVKVRGNFNSIGSAVLGNATAIGSACLDLGGSYNKVMAQTFSCDTHVAYSGSGRNTVFAQTFTSGGQTALTGTPAATDDFTLVGPNSNYHQVPSLTLGGVSSGGFLASSNGGAVSVTKLIPGYKSGSYYGPEVSNTATNSSLVDARMYAMPVVIYAPVTIRSLAIRVVTGGTGSEYKAAIYDSTGTAGRPGTRLGQCSTAVATTSANTDAECALDADVVVQPGVYWLATMHHWTGAAAQVQTYNTIASLNYLTGSTTAFGAIGNSASTGGFVYADTTYASNFPASFGPANEIVGNGGVLAAFRVR